MDDRADFPAHSAAIADRVLGAVCWCGRRLRIEVSGLENLPAGRAMLVANHAFGFDIAFPMAEIWRVTRRRVWALGEHLWWRVPLARQMATAMGTVDGTPENADRLLERDQLVLVLPGGLREAVKPRELRYQLLWGHRYGFVRAAIRNQAPLVPLASVGPDDLFDFVGDAYRRGGRWLGGLDLPIPLPKYLLPVPHLRPFRFIVGEPILPNVPPAASNDPSSLRRLRHEVEGALHELIENELARRAGLAID
jgi:1-acyl-sn-glycerol-3-phosphate acyltransferase